MYETYYWFNKPSETVVLCVNCANERTDNPNEKFKWEDTYPEMTLLCNDCGKDLSR